jgi:hypothetical protein
MASPAPRRVILVGGNPLLQRQIEIALQAWNLEIMAVAEAPLVPQMPRAALQARDIAAQHGASGVVWIGELAHEYSLWFYDAQSDQVVTRPLGGGEPEDAATAAGLALTVKTLLRASTVAPPEERIGAAPRGPGALRIEAAGGGQLATGVGEGFDLRLDAALAWWPGRLGVAARVRTGPGTTVDATRFSGRFGDTSFGAALRTHFALTPALVLEPGVGMSLHRTTLDGALPMTGASVHESFIDPSFDAALALDFSIGERVRLGPVAGVCAFLNKQRYLVGGAAVADLGQVQLELSLRLSLAVD